MLSRVKVYNSSDYDTIIDIDDLAFFMEQWNNSNYEYELGPVSGSAPNYILEGDDLFNISDLMTFVIMWDWSDTQYGMHFRSIEHKITLY